MLGSVDSLLARTRSFLLLTVVALAFVASAAHADDPRSSYLIKLLQSSSQFRVRAQAAISLGSVESSGSTVSALNEALRDVHPAVRAAAATSLGRVGDRSVLAGLRALQRDPEEPVRAAAQAAASKLEVASSAPNTTQQQTTQPTQPSGPALYYIAIAEPASRVTNVDHQTLSQARDYIKQRVQQIQGVVLAPENESNDDATRALRKRSLKGFYLDSAITSVEKKPDGGTRVAVSVIVATYPGRDMRAIMQGAATVSGGGDYSQALQGALNGALRQLDQAMVR